MLTTTPFAIRDENSQGLKSVNKPSQKKGLSFASAPSNSPKKLSLRNENINTIKPRKALGSITSNDLNVRIANKNTNVTKPFSNGFSKSSTINILSENPVQPILNKSKVPDAVIKPSNNNITSDKAAVDDFHPVSNTITPSLHDFLLSNTLLISTNPRLLSCV